MRSMAYCLPPYPLKNGCTALQPYKLYRAVVRQDKPSGKSLNGYT